MLGVTAHVIRWGSSNTHTQMPSAHPDSYRPMRIFTFPLRLLHCLELETDREKRPRGHEFRDREAQSKMKERLRSLRWGRK